MSAGDSATQRAQLVVVGIGADGWAGLGEAARGAVLAAEELVGSPRQLALLPRTSATQRPWPSPIEELVEELVERSDAGSAGGVCILASGDPMLHGIGATLARRLPAGRLVVHPHPSAFALACARLGWPAAEVELVSAVAQPPDVVTRLLQPGRRVVVYTSGAGGAAALAGVLRESGFGPSRFVVLEQLGGPAERVVEASAQEWRDAAADPLHCVAIECRAQAGTPPRPLVAGLPDEAYENDGQLTKRHVRAVTLAALAPLPGALLWDVGAGSGSIAIEWLRAEASARAIAIERHAERAERARANAHALGVPRLEVVLGSAPEALCDLPGPDAIFIGGGLTTMGVIQRCWYSLRPAGTIVANAVTLEGERVLTFARERCGGELARIEIAHAEPLGSFEAWRSQLPVVQWCARKERI
ncbi:MAG TPA: precorrin-6y C5,15-methyltransferase (decarboxylating) subunit CbiE [Solirubrobacteraceae bacterium]|jgi:precorrin-6Y C5,15-methyltransferase (decarboxylating)|nr:precorrin-6y C5,15-methyltransferase (decarboxylating) subunit CbiE [Solirubrobacteraceae bacterium]